MTELVNGQEWNITVSTCHSVVVVLAVSAKLASLAGMWNAADSSFLCKCCIIYFTNDALITRILSGKKKKTLEEQHKTEI